METILLILAYYITIAMILSLISGFFDNPSIAYIGVFWPIILGIVVVMLAILLLYYSLGVFYLFGNATAKLFK